MTMPTPPPRIPRYPARTGRLLAAFVPLGLLISVAAGLARPASAAELLGSSLGEVPAPAASSEPASASDPASPTQSIAVQEPKAMRTLDFDDITRFARGAVSVRQTPEGIEFLRFPQSVWSYVAAVERPYLLDGVVTSAGVSLQFLTDSPTLTLRAGFAKGSAEYGPVDITLDGTFYKTLHPDVSSLSLDQTIQLPLVAGQPRRVGVWFPLGCKLLLRELALESGATLEAAPKPGMLLALGDSNTQGTATPALTYIAIVARSLGLELHNAAIGGHTYDADSLTEPFVAQPTLVVVSFGSNDWTANNSPEKAAAYLAKVRSFWPEVPVVMLAPIFRLRDNADASPPPRNLRGLMLDDYRRRYAEIAASVPGVHFVPASLLMPPDPALLLSDQIHPGETGNHLFGLNLAVLLNAKRQAGDLVLAPPARSAAAAAQAYQ